jgi:hypothetical protein
MNLPESAPRSVCLSAVVPAFAEPDIHCLSPAVWAFTEDRVCVHCQSRNNSEGASGVELRRSARDRRDLAACALCNPVLVSYRPMS